VIDFFALVALWLGTSNDLMVWTKTDAQGTDEAIYMFCMCGNLLTMSDISFIYILYVCFSNKRP